MKDYLKQGAERFCVGQPVHFFVTTPPSVITSVGLFISGDSSRICLAVGGTIRFLLCEQCYETQEEAEAAGLRQFRCEHGVYQ